MRPPRLPRTVMGYVPPPPPRPTAPAIPSITHEQPRRHKRRNRIQQVPTSTNQKIGVGMEVEARDAGGERWEWRTFITFDGHRSLIGYLEPTWRRPSMFEVCGRTRDEGQAWELAREAADDARARHAAQQVRVRRASSDQVPL